MNIVERGRAFLQGLRALAERKVWEWRRCPHCGETETCKWGSSTRRPWFLSGRAEVRVQRHRCARLWADVLGGVGAAGAWWVVRAGGETECDRPLAASGDLDAPDGGGAAVPRFLGTAGAVAGLATAGPGAGGRPGVPAECEHGRAVAGSGGSDGQGRCR